MAVTALVTRYSAQFGFEIGASTRCGRSPPPKRSPRSGWGTQILSLRASTITAGPGPRTAHVQGHILRRLLRSRPFFAKSDIIYYNEIIQQGDTLIPMSSRRCPAGPASRAAPRHLWSTFPVGPISSLFGRINSLLGRVNVPVRRLGKRLYYPVENNDLVAWIPRPDGFE